MSDTDNAPLELTFRIIVRYIGKDWQDGLEYQTISAPECGFKRGGEVNSYACQFVEDVIVYRDNGIERDVYFSLMIGLERGLCCAFCELLPRGMRIVVGANLPMIGFVRSLYGDLWLPIFSKQKL